MQIAEKTVVTMSYTLTNEQGEVLDQAGTEQPFAYLHGANNIIMGLENALTGKQADDSFTVTIPPAEAYGEYDERLTQEVPRSMFQGVPDEQIVAGAQFHAQTNAGTQVIRIAKVEGDTVTIDGNHALAGATLTFEVTVLGVREASEEEVAHGHAHGAGGHQH